MDIPILFEDEDLLIINKPAGITVNKSDTTRGEMTVQDWAEDRLQIANSKWQMAKNEKHIATDDFDARNYQAFFERGGIAHRIDKETSGILLIAKNPEAFVKLLAAFRDRTVEKAYVALAHGILTPASGEINIPVGRLPWNRKQFGVVAGGRESVTYYKTISHYSDGKEHYSFLELKPKTGRTHQIRVHLKYLGHPIVADYLYAGRKTARTDREDLSRVFLHAAKISFPHPGTGDRVSFEAPLPPELNNFLQSLEKVE